MNIEKMKQELFDTIGENGDIEKLLENWNQDMGTSMDNFKVEFKFKNDSDNVDPEYAHDTDAGFDLRANEDVTINPSKLELTKETMTFPKVENGVHTGFINKEIVTGAEYNSPETKIVGTGLYFEIPQGFEIQVRSRSGLAAKSHVEVLNGPGTVDEGYRGEIKVILTNHGTEPLVIKKGDRIAQAVIASVTAKRVIKFTKVERISVDTDRGSAGLGSTGRK